MIKEHEDKKGSRGISLRDVKNITSAYEKGDRALKKVMAEIWSRPEANPSLSDEERSKRRQELAKWADTQNQ